MNRPPRNCRLRREREARLRVDVAGNQSGDVATHRRAVLEPVARAAARDPHGWPLRVSIDKEVTGVGVLVLTDAALDERRAGERRKAPRQPRTRLIDD